MRNAMHFSGLNMVYRERLKISYTVMACATDTQQ